MSHERVVRKVLAALEEASWYAIDNYEAEAIFELMERIELDSRIPRPWDDLTLEDWDRLRYRIQRRIVRREAIWERKFNNSL